MPSRYSDRNNTRASHANWNRVHGETSEEGSWPAFTSASRVDTTHITFATLRDAKVKEATSITSQEDEAVSSSVPATAPEANDAAPASAEHIDTAYLEKIAQSATALADNSAPADGGGLPVLLPPVRKHQGLENEVDGKPICPSPQPTDQVGKILLKMKTPLSGAW